MALQSKLKIADRKTRVFISYSRKDIEFARLLHNQLEAANYQPMLDQTDIAPGEAWQDRLSKLIVQSDVFVFCVSPNSAASKICHWEVDESQRLAKRLVPVVVDPVDTGELPESVAKLNFIFFSNESFEEAFAKLQSTLNSDLGWIRLHTKIAELADEWENHNRSKSRLLMGQALSETEAWVAHQPENTTPPSPSQLQFIAASRKAATGRQRLALMGSLVALAVALSLFAWGEINRRRTQAAYDAATTAANSLVDDLAIAFKDKPGVPPGLTATVLENAINIQDTLVSAGASNGDVKEGEISALNELIDVLLVEGSTEKALTYAEKAEQIAGAVAKAKPTDQVSQTNYAIILRKLGEVHGNMGHDKEAEAFLQQALQINEKLLADQPDENKLKIHTAYGYGSLGNQYKNEGKRAEAEAAFRKQTAYFEALASKVNVNIKTNQDTQSDLAASYEQLGTLLRGDPSDEAKHKEAIGYLRKDVAISEILAKERQDSVNAQNGLSLSYSNLAQALIVSNQNAEAELILKKFLSVTTILANANPLRDDVQQTLSLANNQIGNFYHMQGKDDLAAPYFAADLSASRTLAESDSTNANKQLDLAKSLYLEATINVDPRKNLEEASTILAELAKANKLNPDEAAMVQNIDELKAKLPAQ